MQVTLSIRTLMGDKMRKKRLYLSFFAAVFLIFSVFLISKLTMPKYVSVSREGNLISEYYRETDVGNTHGVVFIGDCEVYSSFIPPLLWERYGITSFVRGSPSQSVAQSYALLCETLEYETPSAVVLSVYALCREEKASEAYNRITLDGMRPSIHKMRAIYESTGEEESTLSYLVPLLRFHSRWSELEGEDVKYLFSRPRVSHNGYFMQKGVMAANDAEDDERSAPHPIPEKNLEYLELMLQVCRERGVELILVKAPIKSWRYPWYDDWSKEINGFAENNRIKYYDLTDDADVIGIDQSLDSYDGGLHLNVSGAEKTTLYFGDILKNEHNIKGSSDARYEMVWREKLDNYYKERNE